MSEPAGMPVVVSTWDGGCEVLIDAEDAPDLLALLDAGVSLRVHCRDGIPHPLLIERGYGKDRITLGLMKALMRAGPRDEPVCLNGALLDCRRANWKLNHTDAIRVWNSKLLGIAAVRGPKKPA